MIFFRGGGVLEGVGDEKESPAPPVQIPFLTPLFACFCVFRWMGGEIEWERKNGSVVNAVTVKGTRLSRR